MDPFWLLPRCLCEGPRPISVGSGHGAAAEGANEVGRLRHLRAGELTGAESLQDSENSLPESTRVAETIEQGVADNLCFVTVRVLGRSTAPISS
jgi:hypothetical protein